MTGWKPGDRVLVNPIHPQKGLMGEMLVVWRSIAALLPISCLDA